MKSFTTADLVAQLILAALGGSWAAYAFPAPSGVLAAVFALGVLIWTRVRYHKVS